MKDLALSVPLHGSTLLPLKLAVSEFARLFNPLVSDALFVILLVISHDALNHLPDRG